MGKSAARLHQLQHLLLETPLLPASESAAAWRQLLVRVAEALLDGSTPLHCAALRGNPAQVDYLLLAGADPLLHNAAGELALELVPVCGERSPLGSGGGSGKLSCRCMGPRDQEAWECRSRFARSLIMRRCALQFRCVTKVCGWDWRW